MKRGSALLIVLGMVAFMTISAIAFAAFMRSARQPSSYLRRTSTSRLLAKAALAEAIDEIDIAIGNDLYPGMGLRGREYLGSRTTSTTVAPETRRRNYWRKGCFIGENEFECASNTVSTLTLEGLAYLPPCMINEARFYSRHAATARWKTLPFEAGRYAFSAFDVSDYFDINRISANVGRNSSDNGRISLAYLFENLDHTDYDDTCKPSDWEKFMNFYVDAEKAREDDNAGRMPSRDSQIPLVSLADYSLAAKENLSAYPNPFCDYIENGQDFVSQVGGLAGLHLRNQMFVTDSYLPKSPLEEKVHDDYDLNDSSKQPFSLSDLSTRNVPIRTAIDYGGDGANRLKGKNWLCDVGLAALWDYLDVDSIPISLAIPTTERTPMICGLEVKVGSGGDVKLQLVESKEAPGGGVADVNLDKPDDPANATVVSYDDDKTEADSVERTVSQKSVYKLDTEKFGKFFNGLFVNALTVYPFRRIENDKNYVIGGRLAFYFTEKVDKGFHTETDNDVLHLGSDAWKYVIENNNRNPLYNEKLGVFFVPLMEKSMAIPRAMATEADAVRGYELEPSGSENVETVFAAALDASPMFTITRSWKQTRTYNSQTGTYTSWAPKEPPTDGADKATTVAAECKIPPLTVGFATDQKYADAKEFVEMVDSGKNAVDVIPQMSIWVYIKETDSGKYVDLVPACVKDDDDLNQIPNYDTWGPDANAFGMPYPLMNFYGTQFSYNPTELAKSDSDFRKKGVAFGISSAVLFCPDPRWNWAPEHWIKPSGATLDATTWLGSYSYRGDNNVEKDSDPRIGRDRDIFMETSDAGYLQSVYELAFLPRLTETDPVRCNDPAWGNMTALDGVGRKDFATSFDGSDGGLGVVNGEFMWRTYRPFPYYRYDNDPDKEKIIVATADDFESIGFSTVGTTGFTSIGTGFRVNPYGSVDTLMAAFANTPFSWFVASTNAAVGAKITESQRNVDDFNKNYAFSGLSDIDDSTFRWDDLKQIANNFYVGVHEINISGSGQINDEEAAVKLIDRWKDSFDGLDWAGTSLKDGATAFADVTLSEKTCTLSDADKKFLYGYWRECFAPRQQLFLVFVRAEPILMGGGSASSAPPALGARAVALVWRDPMPTIEDVPGGQPRPHRTRVLFYRQFE